MRWNRAAAATLLLAWIPLALATAPETKTPLVRKTKYSMGTVYEIAAYDDQPERASKAIDQAFAEVERLDATLSNYKPESDLSRLNREGHFHAVKVPADLYRVIEESVKYSKVSGGKFDITVAPLVDMWKAALRAAAKTAGMCGLREDRIDSSGHGGVSFAVHEDRCGLHRQGIRGGQSSRGFARERD
jgi:thiamine biosynthesis lipoprotein ApbE